MTSQTIVWIILGSVMVPLCATLVMVYVRRWRLARSLPQSRSPISERLLRPAGESLRLKIGVLEEKFSEQFSFAIVFPGGMLAAVLLTATDGRLSGGLAFAAFTLSTMLLFFLLRRVFKTQTELDRHKLGFHGERAVAEELNQLMLSGCRVFHDVPMDPYGNIDHVIVSPAGVFAVETKTRSKHSAPKGKPDHVAEFDGKAVKFPTWQDTEMVDQAARQGKQLSTLLTRAVAEPVAVQAVLALPGWFVKSSVPPGKVLVLNPKQIKKMTECAGPAKLPQEMIQRISHQLERECRTVDL